MNRSFSERSPPQSAGEPRGAASRWSHCGWGLQSRRSDRQLGPKSNFQACDETVNLKIRSWFRTRPGTHRPLRHLPAVENAYIHEYTR